MRAKSDLRFNRCLERHDLLERDTGSAWLDLDPDEDTDSMTPVTGSSASYRLAARPRRRLLRQVLFQGGYALPRAACGRTTSQRALSQLLVVNVLSMPVIGLVKKAPGNVGARIREYSTRTSCRSGLHHRFGACP